MHVSLAVLADYANISQEGKLNILGVFNMAHIREFPGAIAQCYLVTRFVAKAEEKGSPHRVQVRLTGPDGQELLRHEWTIIVPELDAPGPINLDVLTGLAGLTFHSPGPHQFEVHVDNKQPVQIEVTAVRLQSAPGSRDG